MEQVGILRNHAEARLPRSGQSDGVSEWFCGDCPTNQDNRAMPLQDERANLRLSPAKETKERLSKASDDPLSGTVGGVRSVRRVMLKYSPPLTCKPDQFTVTE